MVNLLWAGIGIAFAAADVLGLRRWLRWYRRRDSSSYWASVPGDPIGMWPLGLLLGVELVGSVVAFLAVADLFGAVTW